MSTDKEAELLRRIIGHAFWIGFYAACVLIIILSLVYGATIGAYGPVQKAFASRVKRVKEFNDGEESALGGQVQPDEQPD